MSLQIDLSAIANNDETYLFTLKLNGGEFDLTDFTPTFYLKASRTTPDVSATVISPTVTSATQGKLTVVIPHGDLSTPGTLWYHLDVVDGLDNVTTALFGNVYVLSV